MSSKDLTLFSVWCWLQLTAKRLAHARYQRGWRKKNRAVALQMQKNSYEKFRQERLDYVRTYSRLPETVSRRKAWKRNRRETVVDFKIKENLRIRIAHALRAKASKSDRTEELLGCAVNQLKVHLSAQFSPEMSWENYGSVWEIDHKIPCASFDLTAPEQQRKCFHFSNLQPLLVFDNRSKGAKVLV